MQTFADLGLRPEILAALNSIGFETPTPIQQEAIPKLLVGERDLIGLAQTGTGKTAAFGLPLLDAIEDDFYQVQALVLCPTRELCLQITSDLEKFSANMKSVTTLAVYGGAPIYNQIKALSRGAQVVIGTPGRVLDLVKRGKLDLSHLQTLVLDEADEMLNMGFKDDLDAILSTANEERKTWLFSATISPEIARIARNYMNDPEEIATAAKNSSSANITHQVCTVHAKDKYEAVRRILDAHPDIFGIIFCRTKIETQDIADKLIRDGYNSDALHGDLNQNQRDVVMRRYRDKSLQVLVATDVAARGLDVKEVTHVIHYQLPDDPEVYVHRSGRTGRAGSTGVSIALAHMRDGRKLREIERLIKKPFDQIDLPSGKEVVAARARFWVQQVLNSESNPESLQELWPIVDEGLAELDKTELLHRVAGLALQQFVNEYEKAADLNHRGHDRDRGRDRDDRGDRGDRERRGSGEFAVFKLSLGAKDRINKGSLMKEINRMRGIKGIEIGKIRIHEDHTMIELDKQRSSEAFQAFKRWKYFGRKVFVDQMDGKETADRSFTDRPPRNKGKKNFNKNR
ncbi:MAG: DEAD/DEAH box helicase [Bacteroidetes bacterium]|nr:MAG: DEAD/DEAH box helicase [Bacteroidota bacterium]